MPKMRLADVPKCLLCSVHEVMSGPAMHVDVNKAGGQVVATQIDDMGTSILGGGGEISSHRVNPAGAHLNLNFFEKLIL